MSFFNSWFSSNPIGDLHETVEDMKKTAEETSNKEEDINLNTFSAYDTSYSRAKKIWNAMGFQEDGARIAMLAGYLSIYRELEQNVASEKEFKK